MKTHDIENEIDAILPELEKVSAQLKKQLVNMVSGYEAQTRKVKDHSVNRDYFQSDANNTLLKSPGALLVKIIDEFAPVLYSYASANDPVMLKKVVHAYINTLVEYEKRSLTL